MKEEPIVLGLWETKTETNTSFSFEEVKELLKWNEWYRSKAYDINKLALSVANHETKNCTIWYWLEYNNCFWIKNGNTVPCKRIWNNNMCIYDTKEESYEAFKIIRSTWYKTLPTKELAIKWSWWDRADSWLKNVLQFYNN